MGLLRDAVNLGYITLEQYEEMSDDWSEYGYDARHNGDVEAFEKMMKDFLDLGFDDLALNVFEEYTSAIDFYEEKSGYSMYYDIGTTRWRDIKSGQFVKDPYEWIRD
jgi:hypothetical protein